MSTTDYGNYAISRPEELIEYFTDLVKGSTLPVEYIATYEEKLTPRYPALLIQPGTVDKVVHGTHTFGIVLRAYFYLLHSNLSVSKRSRSLDDLLLATQLVNLLEQSMSLGGKIIHGFVETETPAALPPRSARGSAVVSTRLLWSGVTQRRFK